MAFAAASRYSRVAVLKVGGRTDNYRYPSPACRCTRSITSRTGSNRAARAAHRSRPRSSSTTWSPTGSTCGRYVDVGNEAGTLNQMHHTCLGAVGVTNPDGSPVVSFGAAEALKGQLGILTSG